MDDLIKSRRIQTKVKHTLLEKYLKCWGGIIINGSTNQVKDLHFVYVDCHAFSGRFNEESEDVVQNEKGNIVWGSPIIGIKALDNHVAWAKEKYDINLRVNAILLEKDAKIFDELKKSLDMAGLTQRVRQTDNFFTLQNSEIAILCKDSTLMASKLVDYTQSGHKYSFFVLDPYGPKGTPLSFVHEIISKRRHDALIYMSYLDLHKKTGLVPKRNRSSAEEKQLQNYNAMFGNKKWQDIARDLDSDEIRSGQDALRNNAFQASQAVQAGNLELKLINCYKNSLLSADPHYLAVKSIALHFPDKERTIYYLFLTTHDPTGALKMNEVLSEAGYREHELRWKLRQAKNLPEGQLAFSWFDDPAPPLQTLPRASTEEIGNHILRLLDGKAPTRRDIYAALADEPYFPKEVDKALRFLKKQKKISFDGELTNKTIIKKEPS